MPAVSPVRPLNQATCQADAGTRTPDPLLTMEVLYRLSYVGVVANPSAARRASEERRAGRGRGSVREATPGPCDALGSAERECRPRRSQAPHRKRRASLVGASEQAAALTWSRAPDLTWSRAPDLTWSRARNVVIACACALASSPSSCRLLSWARNACVPCVRSCRVWCWRVCSVGGRLSARSLASGGA